MTDSPEAKLAFIVPYFFMGAGEFPPEFECFLQTVKYNPLYTWILFTDSKRDYAYPKNPSVHRCSFEEMRALFQSKFDFPVSLTKPMKLCDYRPAYGYIFSEVLKGYDYWGYCDIDEYYGNLSKWLKVLSSHKYDRLYQSGHMSIYRNTQKINTLYTHRLQNASSKSVSSYKDIFMSEQHYAFDEWLPDCVTINYICEESDVSMCWDWPLADIGPFCSSFKESVYSREVHNWLDNCESPSCIIVFQKGQLFLYWEQEGKILSKEVLYAHLQKRRLDASKYDPSLEYFAIVPNRIISSSRMFEEKEIMRMLRDARIRQLFRIDEVRHAQAVSTKWVKYQIGKRLGKK